MQTTVDSPGFVYVLSNPAMPGLVKIGSTELPDVAQRVSQLYTTGVPVSFTVEYAARLRDLRRVEAALHIAFHPNRVNPRREFFRIEPEQAIVILRLLEVADETTQTATQADALTGQTETAAREQLRRIRRPNLNFEEMRVPAGAVLQNTENEETATVIGPRKVSFRGAEISLTEATRLLLEIEHNVAPTPYWIYEGVSLQTIYNDTYPLTEA